MRYNGNESNNNDRKGTEDAQEYEHEFAADVGGKHSNESGVRRN